MRTFYQSALTRSFRFGAALCLLVLLTGCGAKLVKPDAADVMSIKVQAGGADLDGPLNFHAKAEDFDALLAILDNPERDRLPAKWEVFGTLLITLKDGSKMQIDLYRTGAGRPGAYSWQRSKRSRPYYRGSSDAQMLKAIEQAYNNVQNKEHSGGRPGKDEKHE